MPEQFYGLGLLLANLFVLDSKKFPETCQLHPTPRRLKISIDTDKSVDLRAFELHSDY